MSRHTYHSIWKFNWISNRVLLICFLQFKQFSKWFVCMHFHTNREPTVISHSLRLYSCVCICFTFSRSSIKLLYFCLFHCIEMLKRERIGATVWTYNRVSFISHFEISDFVTAVITLLHQQEWRRVSQFAKTGTQIIHRLLLLQPVLHSPALQIHTVTLFFDYIVIDWCSFSPSVCTIAIAPPNSSYAKKYTIYIFFIPNNVVHAKRSPFVHGKCVENVNHLYDNQIKWNLFFDNKILMVMPENMLSVFSNQWFRFALKLRFSCIILLNYYPNSKFAWPFVEEEKQRNSDSINSENTQNKGKQPAKHRKGVSTV